jgi:hypothetical protein
MLRLSDGNTSALPVTMPRIVQTNPTMANSDRSAAHPSCSLPSSPDVLVSCA